MQMEGKALSLCSYDTFTTIRPHPTQEWLWPGILAGHSQCHDRKHVALVWILVHRE